MNLVAQAPGQQAPAGAEDVGKYYDHEVAWDPARGGGLIYFLGRDHLSPMLNNEDAYALDVARWRDGISLRVLDLAKRMGIRRSDRVLDLGCGLGGPGRDIAERTGSEVIGVTVSDAQMDNLLDLSEEVGSSYKLVLRADMQQLPFGRKSFDHVFSINSIYHVRRPEAAISEAHRVLSEGGRFGVDDWFVTTRNPRILAQLRRTWSTKHGFHHWDDFVEMLCAQGFVVENVVDYTVEAAAFLCEERFGRVYDRQAAPELVKGFGRLWPDLKFEYALMAVADLRRDILLMGEFYRNRQAAYRQIIARKP